MLMKKGWPALVVVLVVTLVALGCAPGNERWDQYLSPGNLAGFWAGVWHGFIIIITFIVSLFTDEVGLYEVNNTGWPYNLGFLLGLSCSIGGGIRQSRRKRKIKKRDWDEIGERIEEKVRVGIKDWLDESKEDAKAKEWEEIANKIEEKIRKVLKEWVDKE